MRAVFMIAGLLCWAVSLAVFSHWRKATQLSRQAAHWPKVEGAITRSEPKRVLGWHEPDTETVYLWEWSLAYRYHWQGSERIGERFSFVDPIRAKSESELNPRLVRFPVGASVTVSVNPMNPSETILSSAIPPNLLLICILLGVPGLLAMLLAAFVL